MTLLLAGILFLLSSYLFGCIGESREAPGDDGAEPRILSTNPDDSAMEADFNTIGTTLSAVEAESVVLAERQSSWSEGVGVLDNENSISACLTAVSTPLTQTIGSAYLDRISSLGSVQSRINDSTVSLQVTMRCFKSSNLTQYAKTVTSNWPSSNDSGNDSAEVTCPLTAPYGGFVRCRIKTASTLPFVYKGTSCGDGIAEVNSAPATLIGQFTGHEQEMGDDVPLLNNTDDPDTGFGVYGTDIGATFYEGGKMYFAFGDTYSMDSGPYGEPPGSEDGCLPGDCWRSNAMAWTDDFDASDGIQIKGWQTSATKPQWAMEVIPSNHQNTCDPHGERSKIPIAGLGYYNPDAGSGSRLLWYMSIRCFNFLSPPSIEVDHSAFAYSQSDGSFIGYAQYRPEEANFFAGTVWIDHFQSIVYLFGVGMDGGIRLARTETKNIGDMAAYSYWDGSEWKNDDNGDAAELKHAVSVLPAGHEGLRGEISVVWNSYANRFMMMGLNEVLGQIQLFQSPTITGPWSIVDRASTPNAGWYAPMLSEHYMGNAGKDLYFLLSNTYVYNVGLFKASIDNRNTMINCDTP